MLPKPPSCYGCPFYGTGKGFVPDELREGAAVMVVGQNPGAQEEAEGRPFVGKTGEMMERDFFPVAGLTRDDVSVANILRCRLNGTNDVPPLHLTETRKAVEHCTTRHFRLPEGVRLIVTQGAYALWGMTGEGLEKHRTASAWRGYVLPFNPTPHPQQMHNAVWTPGPHDLPVLATLHLAILFKGAGKEDPQSKKAAPAMKVPMKRDWAKVPLILKRAWPQPMLPYGDEPPAVLSGLWAFDTEYDPNNPSWMLRYSLAHPRPDGSLDVRVVERADRVPLVAGENLRVVMHNTPSDLSHLETELGGSLDGVELEDTMYQHSVLWSDLDHDLNFIGSYYARINRWKHLFLTNPREYSAGDAIGTMQGYQGMLQEFGRDEASERVYRQYVLPQAWNIWRSTRMGLRVNQQLAKDFLRQLEEKADDANLWAQAVAGWPINLNSYPQVSHHIYKVEMVKSRGSRRPLKLGGKVV